MGKAIGIDVGYGFVKISDGEIGFSFPSVIGEVSQESYVRKMVKKVSDLDDMRVELNGKRYFVGKSAIRHSQFAFRDLSSLRSDSVDFQVLFFSALSLYCSAPQNTFSIVSGLPVSRMSYAGTLTKLIEEGARITRYLGNEQKDMNIVIKNIEIVPQPLGTYWSDVLDSWGHELKSLEGKTGVIDVGYRTSDMITVLDGEYIAEKSKSFNIGMTTAVDEITSGLTESFGLEHGNYGLDEVIAAKTIKVAGETIDVSHIVNNALEKLAANIYGNVHSLWQVLEYDNILLSGGGCQAIGSYLMPKFKQSKIVTDPMTANCIGYMNWANRTWNNSDDESL